MNHEIVYCAYLETPSLEELATERNVFHFFEDVLGQL